MAIFLIDRTSAVGLARAVEQLLAWMGKPETREWIAAMEADPESRARFWEVEQWYRNFARANPRLRLKVIP